MNTLEVDPLIGLIAVVVPAVIALAKTYLPKVPKALLPVIAPVLGALAEVSLNYAGIAGGNGVVGALLGSAGVGIREIADQSRKSWKGQSENQTPPTPNPGGP